MVKAWGNQKDRKMGLATFKFDGDLWTLQNLPARDAEGVPIKPGCTITIDGFGEWILSKDDAEKMASALCMVVR